MQKIKRLLASALTGITSVALLVSPVAAASTTVVVTPSDMQGWAFFQEIPTGTGSLVEGPGTPPLGTGSAELEVDSTGRELLLNNDYAGTRLADITSLSYSTYRQTGVDGDAATLSLQFDIDNDDSDTETAWQGRLVYEPYFTNTVNTEEWQTWNTLDNAEAGNWWGSPNAVSNLDEVCPQSDPCTWDEVLAAFPDAAIRENDLTDTAGFMHIKA